MPGTQVAKASSVVSEAPRTPEAPPPRTDVRAETGLPPSELAPISHQVFRQTVMERAAQLVAEQVMRQV